MTSMVASWEVWLALGKRLQFSGDGCLVAEKFHGIAADEPTPYGCDADGGDFVTGAC